MGEDETEVQSYGYGFGTFCMCLDIIFGTIFFILLKKRDKKLPEIERVMTNPIICLYCTISILTTFICSFMFFYFVNNEIKERILIIQSENLNSNITREEKIHESATRTKASPKIPTVNATYIS